MAHLWLDTLTSEVRKKVSSIIQIWNFIGIEGARLETRKETLVSHLYMMLDGMYDEELLAQQTIANSIKELKEQIGEVEAELDISSTVVPDGLSLSALERTLFERYTILKEKVASITETFVSIRREEEALSTRLDEPTVVISFRHVPTQDQFRKLKANIDFLTLEKRSRVLELSGLRHDVLAADATVDLGRLKDSELLSQLKSERALEELPLSKTFLSQVGAFRLQCELMLSSVREECERLSYNILNLASRLNIEAADYIDLDQPITSDFCKQLHIELERLTEVRRRNLSIFIRNCQTELQEIWDSCRRSETERDSVLLSTEEPASEWLLDRLEAEIASWRDYYEQHKELFEALNSWQSTFSQFKETEAKKKNPTILKNRGGILLVVDKQYRQLQRELKRLESTTVQLAKSPIHCSVLIHGMEVNDFLEASRRQFEDEKENGTQSQHVVQSKVCKSKLVRKRPGTRLAGPNVNPLGNNPKKSRLVMNKTVIAATPVRQHLSPLVLISKSARKPPGGMCSTPRQSCEFLL